MTAHLIQLRIPLLISSPPFPAPDLLMDLAGPDATQGHPYPSDPICSPYPTPGANTHKNERTGRITRHKNTGETGKYGEYGAPPASSPSSPHLSVYSPLLVLAPWRCLSPMYRCLVMSPVVASCERMPVTDARSEAIQTIWVWSLHW